MKRSLWGWVLFCIFSTATFTLGQSANTSLRGTVKDPSDALVPGAKVTLTNPANGQTLSAVRTAPACMCFRSFCRRSTPWL